LHEFCLTGCVTGLASAPGALFRHTLLCASLAGIIGFCMVDFLAVPAPAAIASGGLLGLVAWAAHMH
jgi:hypothetical protein